jgi:hypothetical protein
MDPQRTNPNAETELPIRAKARIASELPMCKKSSNAIEEPKRDMPMTERELEQRAN